MSGKQPAIQSDDLSVHRYLGEKTTQPQPAYA
jgi:D-amino-acid dehydrogenase